MRILFSSTPGYGHLHPLLPLANAARRAGHEVVVATGPDLAGRVTELGFRTWNVGLSSYAIAARFNARFPEALPVDERLALVGPRMFVDIGARSRLRTLLACARSWRPELIVWEQSEFAAPLVGLALGVRCVAHGWGPRIPRAVVEPVLAAVDALGATIGVSGAAARAVAMTYVDPCPPSLQIGEPAVWGRVQPLRHEDVAAGDGGVSVPDGPLVYVTLGTVVNKTPGALETVVAGAVDGAGGRAVVVTTGPDLDPSSVDVPGGVVVERFIPQAALLPRCDAVVAHAGAGTLLGALAHAVPQVLVPVGAEQYLNAAAAERAGCAVVVPGESVSASSVADALRRVLDEPSFGSAAGRVGSEIAAAPGADEVLAAVTSGEEVAQGAFRRPEGELLPR